VLLNLIEITIMRCIMLVNWSNDWIQVVDNLNDVVIDDFDYENGIHGSVT